MKIYLIALLLLSACSESKETSSDEYVLIEFASKLEEDKQDNQSDDNLKKD